MTLLLELRDRNGGIFYAKPYIKGDYLTPYYKSSMYTYHFDDPVYEARREQENAAAILLVAKRLKEMRKESKAYFQNLPRRQQLDLITDRKKELTLLLRQGSFLEEEFNGLMKRLHKRVNKIYTPKIKGAVPVSLI